MRSTAIVIAALGFVVGPFASSVHAQDDPIVDTDRSGVSTNVTQEELERIPTARDPWKILQLTPGVVTDRGGGVTGQPGAQGTGASPSYYIDGIVVGDPTTLPPTPVDIGDIQVITGNFPAEYGDVTGGVINVITKTGDAETRYPFYFGGRADGVTGRGPSGDLSLDIKIPSGGVNGVGSACIDGARLTPRVGATYDFKPEETYRFDFERPIEFKLDTPLYPYIEALDRRGATGGSVPPCPDAPSGTPGVFFQWERPPRMGGPLYRGSTHYFFGGGTGPYVLDLGAIGERYGIPAGPGTGVTGGGTETGLSDTHVFSRDFYLTGLRSYSGGGFTLDPRVEYEATPPATGEGRGFFLMGVDMGGAPLDGRPDPWSFRMDFDGDGTYDSAFFQRESLRQVCPGVTFGAFKVVPGEGGGYLETDPDVPTPDCDSVYLQDRVRLGDYFSLNLGVRADAFAEGAQENPGDRKLDFSFDDMVAPRVGFTWDVARAGRSKLYGHYGQFYESAPLDRLWISGTYGREESLEEEPPTSSDPMTSPEPTYTFSLTSPLLNLYPRYMLGQYGALENESTTVPAAEPDSPAPGGGDAWLPEDEPWVYIESLGGLTGEAFRVTVVNPTPEPVSVGGFAVVEQVSVPAGERAALAKRVARAPGARATLTANGYCLEMLKEVPAAGAIFRIADRAAQERFGPMAGVLDAAEKLRDAGLLDPDTNLESYFHSIRQWSIWTIEEGFDRDGFVDAFLAHTKKNYEARGQRWTDAVAGVARQSARRRWNDVTEVLSAAGLPAFGSGDGR